MTIENLDANTDVEIVRSSQAVGDLLAAIESWKPLRFQSYEQGVLDTLNWLIDNGNVAPVTTKPFDNEDGDWDEDFREDD